MSNLGRFIIISGVSPMALLTIDEEININENYYQLQYRYITARLYLFLLRKRK